MVVKQFQNGKYTYNYCKFVADTDEDVKNIPVDVRGTMMGCEAYVVSTGKTYILGSGKVWYAASGEKLECSCKDVMPESTVWNTIQMPEEG